ncbi:MAG: DUF305 domain-containing protein [Solirubrobacteraceae bacterium]|nr:DUF305 domain-containing protein [Solirubrobacteraceae bacterium]
MRSALPRLQLLIATALAVLAIGLAACGGSDAGTDEHAGHEPSAATSSTASTASAEEATAAFVRQMIPHHQMAIEMAKAALKRSKRPEVTKLARAVVAAQSEEIAKLKTIAEAQGIDIADPSGAEADDAKALGLDQGAMGMDMNMQALETGDVDRAFLDLMVPHHDGALAMAAAVLNAGATGEVQTLAEGIVKTQAAEIAEMQTWREAWFGDDPAATAPPADEAGHEGHDMGDMK